MNYFCTLTSSIFVANFKNLTEPYGANIFDKIIKTP